MLMPKRVKRRRVFRGRMKGKAQRGNFLAYGDFGIVATEPSWVTARQIEAARIAATPSVAARFGSRFSRTSRSPKSRPRPEWALARARPNTGSRW